MTASVARSPFFSVARDRKDRVEPQVSPLPQAHSDAQLVLRARDGDGWALEALYRRHVHRVAAVVSRLLRGGPDVEDVVQDTFIEAFRAIDQLDQPERAGAWIMRIAIHQTHRRFRRRRLLGMIGLYASIEDEPLGRSLSETAPQEIVSEVARLDEALAGIEPRDRAAWLLHRIEGYSLPDVAELVGTSLATVKRRIARAEVLVAAHVGEASR